MTEQTTVDTSAAAIAAVLDKLKIKGVKVRQGFSYGEFEIYPAKVHGKSRPEFGKWVEFATVCNYGAKKQNAAIAKFIAWCFNNVPALSAQLTTETARADAAEAERDAMAARVEVLEFFEAAAVIERNGVMRMATRHGYTGVWDTGEPQSVHDWIEEALAAKGTPQHRGGATGGGTGC